MSGLSSGSLVFMIFKTRVAVSVKGDIYPHVFAERLLCVWPVLDAADAGPAPCESLGGPSRLVTGDRKCSAHDSNRNNRYYLYGFLYASSTFHTSVSSLVNVERN